MQREGIGTRPYFTRHTLLSTRAHFNEETCHSSSRLVHTPLLSYRCCSLLPQCSSDSGDGKDACLSPEHIKVKQYCSCNILQILIKVYGDGQGTMHFSNKHFERVGPVRKGSGCGIRIRRMLPKDGPWTQLEIQACKCPSPKSVVH